MLLYYKRDNIMATTKKYKAKMYFGCDGKEENLLKHLLINFKSVSGCLKSFNTYTYNGLVYFNLYLSNPINTQRDFDDITYKLDKLFDRVFDYKYKNENNIPLFSTKINDKKQYVKKDYKKPTEKYLFIDDN